jgi:hypothetical protein
VRPSRLIIIRFLFQSRLDTTRICGNTI